MRIGAGRAWPVSITTSRSRWSRRRSRRWSPPSPPPDEKFTNTSESRTLTPRYIRVMRYPASTSLTVLACLFASALLRSCREPQPRTADAPAADAIPAVDQKPVYVPAATIKDLMQAVVDTSADVVWLSVTTEVSSKGLIETRPKNDQDWEKVRQGALTL